MSKPTICAKCKHKMFGTFRCKKKYITEIDYVTGDKTTNYDECRIINDNGKCRLYEGK